ncbi:MAG: MarR family transcriptional regulator [Caulobacter sp.]|nr:MarR family transcriptional regulator [Caulobacter sp.]
MPVKDERLARKIARVRDGELEEARRRFGDSLTGAAFSEDGIRSIAEDINEAALKALWAQPAYGAVARRLAELGVPRAADKGVVAHALRDGFRMGTATVALYLHATPGGLTYSRLLAVGALTGNPGHGKTHALIAYMRFLGYIEPGGVGDDGRERPYRPTERMREAFRSYFLEHLQAITPLSPEAGAVKQLIEAEDGLFDRFMAHVGEGMMLIGMVGRQQEDQGPTMGLFSDRRSGMAMLWRILLSAPDDGRWPAAESFPLSIADLARRCGVSRSHVQRLLKDAEAAGMLTTDGLGGVRVTPLLHQEVHSFLGIFVICLAGCARDLLKGRTARGHGG